MPIMMDALAKMEAGKGLKLVQVPKPVPNDNEVLIRICKTAICGTDLHIYNWDEWSQKTIKPPQVIGHEYVGVIAELGKNVKGLHVGQRVTGEGHIVCWHCRNCRAGNMQWCKDTVGVGVNRDGAFAEYLCIPSVNVIPIDEDLDTDVVSFFDAFGNATHTALMYDCVGEDVLVTGAGPIGIMAAAICKKNGARCVAITDVNDYRLDLARKMNIDIVLNVTRDNLEEAMKQHKIVEGFDIGLEMSGNAKALQQMLDHMRNGGKIAQLGIFGKGADVDWNEITFKGLTITGIYGRRMFETWYKMQAMVQSGLDMTPIITHRFDYKDFQKAFEIMNTGNSGKIVLKWSEF